MRFSIIVFMLLIACVSLAQDDSVLEEIRAYQTSQNEKFSSLETTVLSEEGFKNFTALEFYPVDVTFRVTAKFIRTPNEKPFLMPTTTERLPEYVKYGEAHFEIDDKPLKLTLYKSTDSWGDPEKYGNQLFLPFTDLTSGDGSYGGGRFIDITIPEGETVIIDFNQSYNPYCVYNTGYSCPIPPKENDLLVRIEAGVKDYDKY